MPVSTNMHERSARRITNKPLKMFNRAEKPCKVVWHHYERSISGSSHWTRTVLIGLTKWNVQQFILNSHCDTRKSEVGTSWKLFIGLFLAQPLDVDPPSNLDVLQERRHVSDVFRFTWTATGGLVQGVACKNVWGNSCSKQRSAKDISDDGNAIAWVSYTLRMTKRPTMRPLNLSVSSSTSGAMFCCGTVGRSKLKSSGGVNSRPLSTPVSYAIRVPLCLDTKLPVSTLKRLRLLIWTIQSGDGAIIPNIVTNECAQSTLTVRVVDLPGIVTAPASAIDSTPRPCERSLLAKLINGRLRPSSAMISTGLLAKPRMVKKEMRLECDTAESGENTRPSSGIKSPNRCGVRKLKNVIR